MLYIASVKNDTHEASFLVGASVGTLGTLVWPIIRPPMSCLCTIGQGSEMWIKKTVISNAMETLVLRGRQEKAPAYDEYKMMYSLCDIFVRNLHDRGWPLSIGGHGIYGEARVQHNFAMASILENVFNVYLSHNSVGESNNCYRDHCVNLAEE
jgi:hypothetical protein